MQVPLQLKLWPRMYVREHENDPFCTVIYVSRKFCLR